MKTMSSWIRTIVAACIVTLSALSVTEAEEAYTAPTDEQVAEIAENPSRLLVAFPAEPDGLGLIEALRNRDWRPEALAVGSHAAYIWCPDGVIASQALEAVTRALGGAVTSRNWNTVLRLHALAGGTSSGPR